MKGVGNELHGSREQRLFLLTIFCFLIFRGAVSHRSKFLISQQPAHRGSGDRGLHQRTRHLQKEEPESGALPLATSLHGTSRA